MSTRALRRSTLCSAARLAHARPAPLPGAFAPQLAAPTAHVPDGPGWIHEVKFDGYRLLAFRSGEGVRLRSRNGLDWTALLPDLCAAIAERLPPQSLVDGEIVVLDRRGVSDFSALQNALHGGPRRASSIVFFAFDLPWCDGIDLTRSPLEHRRALLASLIGTAQEGRLRLSMDVRGHGPAVFAQAAAAGLEGIVSKRLGSVYTQHRCGDWLKSKAFCMQELLIGGLTLSSGGAFKALLVGCYDGAGQLVYAGRVRSGFGAQSVRRLMPALGAHLAAACPFPAVPPAHARRACWLRPLLVARIRALGWTGSGRLRHPSFLGLREDAHPVNVLRQPGPLTSMIDDAGFESSSGSFSARGGGSAPACQVANRPDVLAILRLSRGMVGVSGRAH